MKAIVLVLGAAATALVPAMASAASSPNGNAPQNQANGPTTTGQPSQDCEELVADGEGATPGQSANAPGGGSPFSGSDSVAGSHYAGSQPQNSNNPASVSQYDVACANQPH